MRGAEQNHVQKDDQNAWENLEEAHNGGHLGLTEMYA